MSVCLPIYVSMCNSVYENVFVHLSVLLRVSVCDYLHPSMCICISISVCACSCCYVSLCSCV